MPSAKKRLAQGGVLRVQVHVQVPKPRPGVEYTAAFLDDVIARWWEGEKLPARIVVKSIAWTRGAGAKREVTDPRAIKQARENFSRIPGLAFRTVL